MKKAPLVLAAAAVVGLTAIAAPAPAEAHWRGGGWGPGLAGGLIAGALCGFLIVFAERRVRRPVELEVLGMTALAVLSVVGAIAVA